LRFLERHSCPVFTQLADPRETHNPKVSGSVPSERHGLGCGSRAASDVLHDNQTDQRFIGGTTDSREWLGNGGYSIFSVTTPKPRCKAVAPISKSSNAMLTPRAACSPSIRCNVAWLAALDDFFEIGSEFRIQRGLMPQFFRMRFCQGDRFREHTASRRSGTMQNRDWLGIVLDDHFRTDPHLGHERSKICRCCFL
jgi:hypothetical protein